MATEYDQIRTLLESEAVQRADQAISERVRLPVSDSNPAVTLQSVLSEVSASGMSIAEILDVLERQHSRVVELAVHNLQDSEDFGEEFPPGEEPDPDDPPDEGVTTGISRGASVLHAIDLHFLESRPAADLRAYLKKRRVPHHAKVAKELRRIYGLLEG